MLNPNRADSECDDPTIRRCISFARGWGWGYDALEVVNLFSPCTPDPRDLRRASGEAIHQDNDKYLLEACASAHFVLAA